MPLGGQTEQQSQCPDRDSIVFYDLFERLLSVIGSHIAGGSPENPLQSVIWISGSREYACNDGEADVLEWLGDRPNTGDWVAKSIISGTIDAWMTVLQRNDFAEGNVAIRDLSVVEQIRDTC